MGMDLDLPDETPAQNTSKTTKLHKPAAKTEPDTNLADDRARQGDSGRPFCEKHQCLMSANGSGKDVTYYRCPVPDCDCKEKRIRPQFKMSATPKECPHQTCRDPQQYLEAAPAQPSAANITMVCKKCGFKLQQPRPQFRPRENTHLDRLDAR